MKDEFRLFSIDKNEKRFVKNEENDNDVFVNIIIVIVSPTKNGDDY